VPIPFRLQVSNQTTGESQHLVGTIGDDDWRALKRFAEFSRELDQAEYVKAGMPLNVHIAWSQESGFDPAPELPPPGQLREFLHLLRPFLLENEPTRFLRICSILGKYFDHGFFRTTLRDLRRAFLGKISQSYFTLSSHDLVVNSEEALRLWLNAFEYHRDEDKREHLEKLHLALPLNVSKALFVDLLRYKVEAIWWVATFIEKIEASPTTQAYLTQQRDSSVSRPAT
jgi:hypothetical protein